MSILGVARSCAVSLLGLGMLLPASGAVPGDGGRPPLRLAVHAFDIPPQSLASALVTYSGVTGMAVLVMASWPVDGARPACRGASPPATP